MRAISIGIPFIRRRSGVPIDAQAQAHFNRVIADGGVVPSGLTGVNAFFSAVKAIYGTNDINTAISAAYDPHYLGYRLGAGSGTTLGQAAQKLYSVKSTENLVLQSEDFASVSWSRENVSNSGNVTTAPNGTLTADSIIDDNFNSRHINFQTFNGVLSDSRTFSIYAKQNTLRYLFLSVTNVGDSHCYSAIFDLQLGVVSATKVNGNGTISASIESAANGWYRCIISGTMTTGSANFFPLIGTSDRPAFTGSLVNNNAPSYIGSNQSLFIWGAQLNTGSVALPYTSTTTTAQTLADVTQTTAASQPLLLAHTGENYWFGSGVTGNFVQTPNAAANNIVNDFDIKITATYIFNSTFNAYIGKWDSGQQSWRLYLDTGNRLIWNIQGHALYPSNAINSTMNHLRVTRQASNGEIKYFFSTQALNTPIESITWTQLGTTQIGPTGSAPTTTSSLRIGQEQGNPFNGRIYRVTLANAIDGTPVVDFNPSSYNPATSQTQWTSATGEVWTINTGTATTGFKGVLVDRSIVQGNGISMFMTVPSSTAMFNFMHNGTGGTAYYVSRRFQTASFEYGIMATNNGSGSTNGFYITDNVNNISYSTSKTGSNVAVVNAQTTTTTSLAMYIAQYRDQAGNDAFTGRNNVLGAGVAQTSTPTTADAAQNLAFMAFSITGSGSANMNFTSVLLVRNMDNSTQQTAMYNALKSYNNGAF